MTIEQINKHQLIISNSTGSIVYYYDTLEECEKQFDFIKDVSTKFGLIDVILEIQRPIVFCPPNGPITIENMSLKKEIINKEFYEKKFNEIISNTK